MTSELRATLLAATLLVGLCGAAGAAERPDGTPAPERGSGATGSTTSVGAGGLTGSGATEDGTRRTGGKAPAPATERGGSTAPAAGTTR